MRELLIERLSELTKALNELRNLNLVDAVTAQVKITLDTYELNRALLKNIFGIHTEDEFKDLRKKILHKVSLLKGENLTGSLLN